MIKSETVQQRGLQIVDMNRILHHVHAEVIGLPNGYTGLETTSGGPHRKATGMMVTARLCFIIVAEVAERMRRTQDSVKKLWVRAIARLREALSEGEE